MPILVMILAGIIIFAFIFNAEIQVSNAAREGARAGSLYRLTRVQSTNGVAIITSLGDTVNNAVYPALGYLPVAPDLYSVTYAYYGNSTVPQLGDTIVVTLTYSYTVPVLSVALPIVQNPIVITRSVVMEVQ